MGTLSDLVDELIEENKKLKEKVEELSTKIDALKKEVKQKKPKGKIWKPERGEEFWGVDSVSNVYKNIFYGDVEEVKHINGGNCYPTEEKAQFEANREKYTRLFRQYVEQHSEPLNWSTNDWGKWYVCYDHDTKEICYDNNSTLQYMGVYGSSEEVMQDAVAFIGEDNFLKYVLGVKNE